MSGETSYGVDLDDVLAVVGEYPAGTPLTARELAAPLSCSRRTAYAKLEALAARGDLETKKVGARGRVWWRPAEGRHPVADADRDDEPDRTLESLASPVRTIGDGSNRDEIADAVVTTLDTVVDVADAMVYYFDTTENRLLLVAATGGPIDGTDHEPIEAGADSAVWQCFVDGESRTVDATAESVVPGSVTDDRRGLVMSLGDHGVVVATADDPRAIEDVRTSVDLVATVATTALDCVESRARLREHERRLEERAGRLRCVTRIAGVVRSVNRALVDATTLEAVRSSVCSALTADDAFPFAWIGTVEDGEGAVEDDGGTVVPQASAGEDHGYLDSISLGVCDSPVEPTVEAASTGEVVVASNVATGLRRAPWRREAISRGLQSAVSVPLTHGAVRYGVLTVYADEPDAFGEFERTAFAELGETIGNAMDAIATRERLLCDTVVELEFVLDDATCFVSDLVDATGGEIRLDGVVPVTDDRTRLFFTVSGVREERVTDAVEAMSGVESTRLVDSRGDQHLVEVVVAGRTIPSMIHDHEASIRTLTADGAAVRVAVDLPSAADVRAFVERFQAEYPSTEFVARREHDRPLQTRQGFRSALDERLTDRQREVLETAYHSGLYASPRQSTVGEIAETLGVSQPTVTEHLQSAESKLLDLVFDENETTD